MLIDTHCHVDQFPRPEEIVRDCEAASIRVVAVTNLASHFAIAAERLKGLRMVTAALGAHPLAAREALREMDTFRRLAPNANFIGEIGLDFSKHGAATRGIQERVFDEVLAAIKNRQRFITLHSRGAEKEVLDGLRRHGIGSAVFHWYSGPESLLDEVFSDGHYLSFNPSMLESAKGQRLMARTPKDRILAETDGPFVKVAGVVARPSDIALVYRAMAGLWRVEPKEANARAAENFERIAGATR
jgi:TatD DNase family protein